MADYSKYYEAREVVTRILEQDFIGPVTKDECLAEVPVQYYIMGKLYPQKDTVEALDLARNPLLENEIETYDVSISLSNQNNPSSMGITVTLKVDVSAICVSGSYAFYEPTSFDDAKECGIDTSRWEHLEKKPKEIWQRNEYSYDEKVIFTGERVEYADLPNGLQLQVYTHSIMDSGERVITIALVNENQSENDITSTSRCCAFQPVIRVSSSDGTAVFTSVNRQTYLTTDPELLELDMLYSDVHCYAQGHGCSVMWDMDNAEPEWVESAFFPTFNLRQMKAAEVVSGNVLSMQFLSTATIRNEANQIMALYGRGHTQFPPQGLSAKDSFFAIQSTPEERPARQYFGVMGIGTTATTTLIRVNAAMLFATRYLATLGYPDAVVDNFWTITGYFNSLRELGGASTQILDDVQSRLDYLAKTKFVSVYPGVDTSKGYTYTEELTSRMSNSEITDIIQVKLKRSYTKDNHADVFDYLLASNMISVGVDVGRLGAMVVAGQPKTNAEYIQATSRVGRDNPGLVIAVYNASRSRDRSHYEQFLKYHSALYRYVEATSLTPFSDRARDRGLHALYVSLCRYLIENLRGNSQAINYRSDNPEIRKVEKIIIDYVRRVDPDELSAVMDELKDIQDAWDIAATGSLVYKSRKNEKKLLKGDTENDRFRMMNSMRNVDGQSGIYLLGGL